MGVGLSQVMGKMMGMMGNPLPCHLTYRCGETPAQLGFRMERTTGFEPATLTLAKLWNSSGQMAGIR